MGKLELPLMAAIYSEAEGGPVMVKRGEQGYYPLSHDARSVDEINRALGLNTQQVKAMEAGSKLSWDSPLADPIYWIAQEKKETKSLEEAVRSFVDKVQSGALIKGARRDQVISPNYLKRIINEEASILGAALEAHVASKQQEVTIVIGMQDGLVGNVSADAPHFMVLECNYDAGDYNEEELQIDGDGRLCKVTSFGGVFDKEGVSGIKAGMKAEHLENWLLCPSEFDLWEGLISHDEFFGVLAPNDSAWTFFRNGRPSEDTPAEVVERIRSDGLFFRSFPDGSMEESRVVTPVVVDPQGRFIRLACDPPNETMEAKKKPSPGA